MKTQHGFLAIGAIALATAIIALGSSQPLGAADEDAAPDQGSAQVSAYPHGCVDCHTAEGAGLIGGLLADLGHPEVDDIEVVPDGCIECHSDADGFSLMSELVHFAHYAHPPENAYLRDYDANCLHCHAMDLETGAVTVKSGPMKR